MTYKLIDLFCGAGGMTLGFVDSRFCGGFDPVLALDFDRAAIATHEANFGSKTICGSVETWLADRPEIPKADVVIGGPPCQGFSLLNKNRRGDRRRALWEPYLDIVELSDASVFVMENVSELLRSPELLQIRSRAEQMGFASKAAVLNAADYGAPQTRKRTVVVGWKDSRISAPQFPPAVTHASPDLKSSLLPWLTVRDVIADLDDPRGTDIREETGPHDLHFGRNPTETSLARYRAVPPGGNRFDLMRNAPHITPPCWIRKTAGGTDLFGRLWWDRPSVTIRTEFFKPEKGRYLHPDKHRPITHREAARLMGFPDDFVFKGGKTEIARQIGNAVPPALANTIARMVKDMLDRASLGQASSALRTTENYLGEVVPV